MVRKFTRCGQEGKANASFGGLYINLTMTENSKLSKNDLKWIKFNQKMARMSGKKKLKKQDFFDALKEAHDEAYND